MKTAFSSFIYSRKGIYGILHVLILCLSLFLIISISMDTFHNIPLIFCLNSFWHPINGDI